MNCEEGVLDWTEGVERARGSDMSTNGEQVSHNLALPRGRILVGGAVFVLGQLSPLLIPLVIWLELPAAWTVAVTGLLLFGIPELFLIATVAIMGKAGLDYIKRLLRDALKKYMSPDRVSATRYRIGLVMFILPLLLGFCGPYIGHLFLLYRSHPVVIGLVGDLMLVSNVFVLGGDF